MLTYTFSICFALLEGFYPERILKKNTKRWQLMYVVSLSVHVNNLTEDNLILMIYQSIEYSVYY